MSSKENKWTEEQLAAIITTGCDLLVAAGAGSGKTAVLVERIIRKVIDEEKPVDIDKLLVVTFTNAAASEMRERVGAAITKELDKNPDSAALQRQLTLLPKTSITTIHSFCLEVIRNNFQVINIDPNFRIADETEMILLKQEIIEELFDSKYEIQDSGFLGLVEAYGGSKSDEKLMTIVHELYKFAESSPWPEKWLRESAADFNIDDDFTFEDTKWARYLLKSIGIEVNGLAANMQRAIDIIYDNEELESYSDNFQQEILALGEVILDDQNTWKSFYDKVFAISFGRLKPIKGVDEQLKKSVTEIRDKVKKRVKTIQSNIERISEENIKQEMQQLYPAMKCIAELAIEFKELYREKKREKSVIDFNDIEHYALDILTIVDEKEMVCPSETALLYRSKFEEVLVDEYQDSNLVQEVMLSMVSRRDSESKNLFMVGDVKQSIYRFRQAMPELFLSKYHAFQEKHGTEQKIMLFKNFRSRKEVIDGVNFIFKQIMSENIGELDYNDVEKLNLGANFPELIDQGSIGGAVELHIVDCEKIEEDEAEGLGEAYEGQKTVTTVSIETDATTPVTTAMIATMSSTAEATATAAMPATSLPVEVMAAKVAVTATAEGTAEDSDGGAEEEEDLSSIELEARLVIMRIKQFIDGEGENEFKVFDKTLNAYRRVEYRDIVILLRATKSWANIFLENFSKEGIPAFADTGTGYFDTIEIKTILSLLQVIDNPMQDIPLLAVLRSPIFAFTPKELIDIHLENKADTFYQSLKKMAEAGISELSMKAADFMEKLVLWQKKAIYTPVDEFLWSLFMETGYFGYAGAMPGGVQRQANLKVLFERAKQFETTSYKGLFNFINFINRLKRSSGDMGSAKVLGENENVVRIMSIHKSKGLEFPVVFVSGTGKGFNMMDLQRSILFHKELGFGPDFVDYNRRYSYGSTIKEAIKTRIRLETLSEEMRVLYVAFTRAREKLIITGNVKNVNKMAAKWAQGSERIGNKLSEFEILTSKNYLDWICPAIINHKDGRTLAELGGSVSRNPLEEEGAWRVELWDRDKLQNLKPEINKVVDVVQRENLIGIEVDIDSMATMNEDNEAIQNQIKTEEEKPAGDALKKLIEDRLSYEYCYRKSSKIPAKISVSELKRAKYAEPVDDEAETLFSETKLKKPAFLQEKQGPSAADKGTIMHYVMQQIDIKNVSNLEEIKSQLQNMKEAEILTEAEMEVINPWKIYNFFRSPLGLRMTQSDNVMKEVPFSIEVPASEIYTELSEEVYSEEKIMLQGIIDCCFVENNEFILLDYKTDYVEEGKSEVIKNKYQLQIDCYVRALERITGRKVDRKYLYLFYNNEIVECE